jgi:hypothetical protein
MLIRNVATLHGRLLILTALVAGLIVLALAGGRAAFA